MDDTEFRKFIDEIKDKADLATVMGETGAEFRIDPRRRGKYLVGVVHSSLCVDPDRQIYTWFSKSGGSKSGNESGDVFAWLERYGKMDFWQAALHLAEKLGVHVPSGLHAATGAEDAGRAASFRARTELFEVACAWFEGQLWSNPAALAYVRSRGWSDETIRAARLGYSAPDQARGLVGELKMYEWDVTSPEAVMLVGLRGGVKEWCKRQGIEGQANWLEHDRVWGLVDFPRIVYPHVWRGRVVYFSSRNLKWEDKKRTTESTESTEFSGGKAEGGAGGVESQGGHAGEGRHADLPQQASEQVTQQASGQRLVGEHETSRKGFNPPRALSGERQRYFNHCFRKGAEEVVLVEGQADAITLGQWGIPAVALMGLAADEVLKGAVEGAETRYVALDSDAKGQEARWKVGELLGPMTRVVRWPEKDANDWLQVMVRAGRAFTTESTERLSAFTTESTESTERLSAFTTESTESTEISGGKAEGGAGGDAGQGGQGAHTGAPVREGGEGDCHAALAMTEEGQVREVRRVLGGAVTLVEELASWAGSLQGAKRDEGLKRVFGLVRQMDKMQRANYRSSLADRLGVGIRHFNDLLKAAGEKVDEDAVAAADFVETLGGFIEGWLVEYLYDTEKKVGKLAFRDPERRVGVAEALDIGGKRYVPRYPGSFIQRGACLFASELGPLKDTKELVAIVEGFIRRWYLLESGYMYRLIAYYVLMTWVYDAFSALCYLRATGEAGAGKSELMRRIGPVCYRYMPASGSTSPSSFFRAIEEYKGTLFIDEADLKDGGDMSNDLVKVLNLGAMKGGHIWRMEEVQRDGQRDFEVASFNTFGPKLIAMRKEFRDDAVASRSLTLKLMPREPLELKLAGVPLVVSTEFNRAALGVRNMLIRWRLQVWEEEIPMREEDVDLEISARLNQVTMPLKALARDDAVLRKEIEVFLREYNREIVLSKSMTLAARVVEALWKIHQYPDLRKKYVQKTADGSEFLMIGDVRQIANELIDEMNSGGDKGKGEGEGDKEGKADWKKKRDELSARGVGSIIRQELQLRVGNRRGSGFPVFWDEVKMQALARRYGYDVSALPSSGEGGPVGGNGLGSNGLGNNGLKPVVGGEGGGAPAQERLFGEGPGNWDDEG